MPKKLYLGRGTIQEYNAKKSAERAEKRKQKKVLESKEKNDERIISRAENKR